MKTKNKNPFRLRSSRHSSRGVALFFFIFLYSALLGFLLLVINTGTLIYQKIRLQSAVDLAAYAGASVQAAYLGNGASQGQDIMSLNLKITERYQKMQADLDFKNIAPWPGMLQPGAIPPGVCEVLCAAANVANANKSVQIYRDAAADMETYRQEILRIMGGMNQAAQRAAEATLKINVPDLDVGDGGVASLGSQTTNKVADMLKNSGQDPLSKKKNAVLSFTSSKALYLANIVAPVLQKGVGGKPVAHNFTFYGPMCFDYNLGSGQSNPSMYCAVNGAGYPGGVAGWKSAYVSYLKSFAPAPFNGNVGTVEKITGANTNAIRLNFLLNPHRPQPFMMVAAEWNPTSGPNLDNFYGAKRGLFPKTTRLAAISLAQPFGGNIYTGALYGTRLESIQRVLLDPRFKAVSSDYEGLPNYIQSFSPKDKSGKPVKSFEEMAQEFLH